MSEETGEDPQGKKKSSDPSQDASAEFDFGRHLKQLREQAGLTQEQLSFTSGISQAQIFHLERGNQEPRLNTIRALARGLGAVSLDVLLDPLSQAIFSPIPASKDSVAIQHAVDAGRIAEASAKTLGLPEPMIQLAEAQAVGRAAVPERLTGRGPGA